MSFENENELVGAQLLHPCRLHLLDPSQCDLEYNGNGSAHGEDGNGRGDDGHLGQLALLHRLHLLDLVQRDLGYNGHGGVHDGVHGGVDRRDVHDDARRPASQRLLLSLSSSGPPTAGAPEMKMTIMATSAQIYKYTNTKKYKHTNIKKYKEI